MSREHEPDTMREGYAFSGGIRGKHSHAYRQGTNVVLLEPEVAAIFTDAAAVNAALRRLAHMAQAAVSKQDRG